MAGHCLCIDHRIFSSDGLEMVEMFEMAIGIRVTVSVTITIDP